MKKRFIICTHSSNSSLIALSAKEAETNASTEKWQQIAIEGKWKGHVAGPFSLDNDDLNKIVQNFKNSKATEIVVDYEHASLYGEKAVAAGWISALKVEGQSLFAKIAWLDDAKELIKSKKYKYLSPVLNPQTIDQTSGDDLGWSLHSVALTNKPFFEELDEVKINKNQSQKKGDIVDKEKFKKLEDDLKAALDRVKELEGENKELKSKEVEAKVDGAVAAKKVSPDQKESLLAFGASNPEGLSKFLESAKAQGTPFSDDKGMFVNSQSQGGDGAIDVLALGGIE